MSRPDFTKPLRDAILLEADYLDMHADVLETCAKEGLAAVVVRKRLATSANQVRARVKMLHEVLAETEPKAEAKAP
jgi:hypothetical protein